MVTSSHISDPELLVCSRCDIPKDPEEFHRSANAETGRRSECKKCRVEDHVKYVLKCGEAFYDRAHANNKKYWKSPRGKAVKSEQTGRHQERNTHRSLAHNWARRNKKLLGVCSRCGERTKTRRFFLNYDIPPKILEYCYLCCTEVINPRKDRG